MTTPSTSAPNPTSTLASRDIDLLGEIDLRSSLSDDDKRMLRGDEIDRCVVMENDGLLELKRGFYIPTDAGRAALASAVPVPAVTPDLIAEIVAALEAALEAAITTEEQFGDGNGSNMHIRRSGRLGGTVNGLQRAVAIVKQIGGAS